MSSHGNIPALQDFSPFLLFRPLLYSTVEIPVVPQVTSDTNGTIRYDIRHSRPVPYPFLQPRSDGDGRGGGREKERKKKVVCNSAAYPAPVSHRALNITIGQPARPEVRNVVSRSHQTKQSRLFYRTVRVSGWLAGWLVFLVCACCATLPWTKLRPWTINYARHVRVLVWSGLVGALFLFFIFFRRKPFQRHVVSVQNCFGYGAGHLRIDWHDNQKEYSPNLSIDNGDITCYHLTYSFCMAVILNHARATFTEGN